MTKQELLQTIQQATQEKVTGLNLSSQELTELPPEIGHLTQLQWLDLCDNQLTHLPPELGHLTQLQGLFLSVNQLTHLPPEFVYLTQLQVLIIDGNQLTHLPPELGHLTQLRLLVLDRNQLTHLPPELVYLTQLQWLDLRDNQLTELLPFLESVAKTIEANVNQLSKGDRKGYPLGLYLQGNPFQPPIPPEILDKVKHPTDIIYYAKALQAGSRPLHEVGCVPRTD